MCKTKSDVLPQKNDVHLNNNEADHREQQESLKNKICKNKKCLANVVAYFTALIIYAVTTHLELTEVITGELVNLKYVLLIFILVTFILSMHYQKFKKGGAILLATTMGAFGIIMYNQQLLIYPISLAPSTLSIFSQYFNKALQQYRRIADTTKRIADQQKNIANYTQYFLNMTGFQQEKIANHTQWIAIQQQRIANSTENTAIQQQRIANSTENTAIQQQRIANSTENTAIQQQRIANSTENTAIQQQRIANSTENIVIQQQRIANYTDAGNDHLKILSETFREMKQVIIPDLLPVQEDTLSKCYSYQINLYQKPDNTAYFQRKQFDLALSSFIDSTKAGVIYGQHNIGKTVSILNYHRNNTQNEIYKFYLKAQTILDHHGFYKNDPCSILAHINYPRLAEELIKSKFKGTLIFLIDDFEVLRKSQAGRNFKNSIQTALKDIAASQSQKIKIIVIGSQGRSPVEMKGDIPGLKARLQQFYAPAFSKNQACKIWISSGNKNFTENIAKQAFKVRDKICSIYSKTNSTLPNQKNYVDQFKQDHDKEISLQSREKFYQAVQNFDDLYSLTGSNIEYFMKPKAKEYENFKQQALDLMEQSFNFQVTQIIGLDQNERTIQQKFNVKLVKKICEAEESGSYYRYKDLKGAIQILDSNIFRIWDTESMAVIGFRVPYFRKLWMKEFDNSCGPK